MAQCPTFYNSSGVLSSKPYWIGCSGGNYTMFVQSNVIISGYNINWGDGTANSTGAMLIPPAFISHTYLAAVDTFLVTITTTVPACVIHGVVVMELTPSASIQIPLGSPIHGCTPAAFNFQNASTNVSQTTFFTWTFGDGSAAQKFNYTNMGQTISHTYLPGTASCNVAVTLKAENYCNKGTPSTNVYQPIQVWDKDVVNITPDASVKCAPSNTFHFNNTTALNCSALGNNQQRYEYWNFGNYWGLGHDSIIDWMPFSPPNRAGYDITFPGVGTYSVLLKDSSYCGTNQKIVSVQIKAPPVADLSLNHDSICKGLSITAANLSTGSANQFIWNFGDGSAIITVPTMASQTHTYTTAGTFTVTLISNISGASGCTSTATKQIVVKSAPTPNFTLGANNFCDSGTETFTNTSTGSINSYSWIFGNGNTSALPSPASQTYTGAGTYNVVLNVTGTNSCSASITKPVYVFQSPNSQINPYNACKGVSGTFSDASTGGPLTSWLWNFGDGSAAGISQNPAHTYADSGYYKVRLTVTTLYCSNKDSILARVNPLPIANFLKSAVSGCTPLIISFTNQSTGAATYSWNFGDGTALSTALNPIHTFTNATTADVTYTISLTATTSFGCTNTISSTITVFHAAHASFTSDYLINCSPVPVQFTNTSTGAVSNSWDFGDGTAVSAAASPNHVFSNNTAFLQTYTAALTVTSANGCTNSAVQNIQVYPKPNFSFVALPSDVGCSPLTISFNATSGGAVYQWDFGDGAASLNQSPNHAFINNKSIDSVFHVVLITTSPFSCKDTADLEILVHPIPAANFTRSASLGCSPLTVNFTDNSIMANTSLWDFGDGGTSTAVNPVHTFINNTSASIIYNVTLEVKTAAGCSSTIIKTVEVFPKVTAAFVSPSNACSPLSIVMVNNSTNAAFYNWNFGDGTLSTLTNPQHIYITPAFANVSYTISLKAQSALGCRDSISYPITVFYKPGAGFSVSGSAGCQPFPVVFTNASFGAVNNDWTFGDGNTANGVVNTNHTYLNTTANSITNNARLIVTTANSCRDTIISPITVYPKVVAAYTGQADGCSPLNISLTNLSTNADSYYWDLGDGVLSSLTNPLHTYTNNTAVNDNLNITLTSVSNLGCRDSIQKPINVFYKPHANFNISSASGCQPLSVAFSDLSTGGIHYFWDFGDASLIDTTFNPSHTYVNMTAASITYTAKLTITTNNGCSSIFTKNIVVYPHVAAAFTGQADGCSPLSIGITNMSTNLNNYNWDFGDGAFSTLPNPSHTYINNTTLNNNLNITLTASSSFGCRDSIQKPIKVFYKPNSNFNISTASGCQPLNVVFSDLSTGGIHYFWDFGDASPIDTTINPSHVYINMTAASTTYTAKLTITTNNGCSSIFTKNIVVYPHVTAAFTGQADGCSPLSISITNLSTNLNNYNWDFGDGTLSTLINPLHTYINNSLVNNNFNIILKATSSFGCRDSIQKTINIFYKPNANFNINAVSGCHPLSIAFSDQSTGGTHYSWNFGDASPIDTTVNPTHIYTNFTPAAITFAAKLIITTDNGCTSSFTKNILVYPHVTAAFTGQADGCSPLNINITNLSSNMSNYNWDLGDGTLSAQVNPSHTYINNTTVNDNLNITLTASSNFGCRDSVQKPINVFYKPNANFNVNAVSGCHPLSISFSDQSAGGIHYSWNFGDGSQADTTVNPTHVYTNYTTVSITYTSKLTITTNNGCTSFFTKNILVYPHVIAAFTGQANGCSPLNITLTNLSTNTNSYNWDLGDGTLSSQAGLSHIFTNNSSANILYTILLTAVSSFGCIDTQTTTVNVKFKPLAAFSQSINSGCSPLTADFTSQSANAQIHHWSFGDGTPFASQPDVSHTYINGTASSITNNIVYIVTANNGCTDTAVNSIAVYPKVTAAFTCPLVGCTPYSVNINNQSINAVNYIWDFGDGNFSGQATPSNIYNNATMIDQTYTIQLIASSNLGCADTVIHSTIAAYQPVAGFSATPFSQTYPLAEVSVINSSNAGAWNYKWSWGDSNNSLLQTPNPNIYSTWGTYAVTLIVSSVNCADTATHSITILPPLPIAGFNIPPYVGCEPDNICFANNSQYTVSSNWEFGDGNSSNSQNPCYTYYSAGTFNVKLTATGPGGQTDIANSVVIIHPTPQANFSASPTLVQIPNTQAEFNNSSMDADSYFWNFGDGGTSIDENPEYAYAQVGNYDVTLIAATQYGCTDTLVKLAYIRAEQINDIIFPNAFTPSLMGPNGGVYDPTSYTNDVFFPFTINGIDEYKLSIFNRWGELVFSTTDLKIGWDGYYKGNLSKQDVYIWRAEGKYLSGIPYLKSGDVMLFR